MLRIAHKRGDTFAPTAQYCNEDGTPASLAGCTIKAQLHDAGHHLVREFVTEITNAATGEYRFLPVDTNAWPLAVMSLDIEYSQGGLTVSTETLEIEVVRKISRA